MNGQAYLITMSVSDAENNRDAGKRCNEVGESCHPQIGLIPRSVSVLDIDHDKLNHDDDYSLEENIRMYRHLLSIRVVQIRRL